MIGTAMLFINNIVNLKPYIALGCRILQGGAQELDLVPKEGPKVVLLVIAHPDDESMFFVPSILAAAKTHHGKENHKPLHLQKGLCCFQFPDHGISARSVKVLCLSNGNYEGKGKIRERELIKACELLGVSAMNPQLPPTIRK
jgi:hypothetical protein